MRLSFVTQPAEPPAEPAEAADWSVWAADQRPPALFVSAWSGRAVHGFDSPMRIGGVVAQPAQVVLGIRGWQDAFEHTMPIDGHRRPVPFALFDIEKIVRMMLHQSGLAFEILASPAVLHHRNVPARRIVEAAVTDELLSYYRDVARGAMTRIREVDGRGASPADALDVVRHALTGVALADGWAVFDLWELCARYGPSDLDVLMRQVQSHDSVESDALSALFDHVETLIDRLSPDSALPDQPQNYDWLDALVVETRQSLASSKPSHKADPSWSES